MDFSVPPRLPSYPSFLSVRSSVVHTAHILLAPSVLRFFSVEPFVTLATVHRLRGHVHRFAICSSTLWPADLDHHEPANLESPCTVFGPGTARRGASLRYSHALLRRLWLATHRLRSSCYTRFSGFQSALSVRPPGGPLRLPHTLLHSRVPRCVSLVSVSRPSVLSFCLLCHSDDLIGFAWELLLQGRCGDTCLHIGVLFTLLLRAPSSSSRQRCSWTLEGVCLSSATRYGLNSSDDSTSPHIDLSR